MDLYTYTKKSRLQMDIIGNMYTYVQLYTYEKVAIYIKHLKLFSYFPPLCIICSVVTVKNSMNFELFFPENLFILSQYRAEYVWPQTQKAIV